MDDASRQPESGEIKTISWIAAAIGSGALSLVVGLVVDAFQVAGVIDMAMAHILMALAWFFAVISICIVGVLGFREYTFKFICILVVTVSVVLIGADYWMVRKRAERDMADAQPKLSVDSEPNPMSIIYENKVWRRKISKRARVMVTNVSKKSVDNVKVFVTEVDDMDCRQQLPVSSLDTAFERPNPSPVEGGVTLNRGEEGYFDALVECVAPTCPNGDLAVPDVESGRRLFGICSNYDVVSRPKSLTIRVFGDGMEPVTKTFVVLEPGKELLLQPQSGETTKQDIH